MPPICLVERDVVQLKQVSHGALEPDQCFEVITLGNKVLRVQSLRDVTGGKLFCV